jgi:hypothetical protein
LISLELNYGRYSFPAELHGQPYRPCRQLRKGDIDPWSHVESRYAG